MTYVRIVSGAPAVVHALILSRSDARYEKKEIVRGLSRRARPYAKRTDTISRFVASVSM